MSRLHGEWDCAIASYAITDQCKCMYWLSRRLKHRCILSNVCIPPSILITSAKVALPIDTHERERPPNKMAGDETKQKYAASSYLSVSLLTADTNSEIPQLATLKEAGMAQLQPLEAIQSAELYRHLAEATILPAPTLRTRTQMLDLVSTTRTSRAV